MPLVQLLLPSDHLPILHIPCFQAANLVRKLLNDFENNAAPPIGDYMHIPGTDLDTRFIDRGDTLLLSFRKSEQPVYTQVLCYDDILATAAMGTVADLYTAFRLGSPAFPRMGNWIHMVPLTNRSLSVVQTSTILETTRYLYAMTYAFFNREKFNTDRPLNELFDSTVLIDQDAGPQFN